ncbi:MAG: type VI secretion system tip protein VgrG [Saprospiraceae bacterium]|nr:type VI secretion system tip protein VgrG [Saprospiraceae bacterium]
MFDLSLNQLLPPMPDDTSLVTFTVKVNGMRLPDTIQVQALRVTKSVNRIPWASLTVIDGNVAEQNFEVSDTNQLCPGNSIEISVGYHHDEQTIFKGMIVRHAVKIREGRTFLDIECKDEVVKLSVARSNKYYFAQKDSEIIEEILNAKGLSNDVQATQAQHLEMVQYAATDWDFIVTRAEANAMLVVADNGTVRVKKPDFEQDAKINLVFGSSILELEAEMDARDQFPAAKVFAWDSKDLALREAEASGDGVSSSLLDTGGLGDVLSAVGDAVSAIGGALGLDLPGAPPNTDFTQVMGLENFPSQHPGNLSGKETEAWAEAQFTKSRLAKLRGTVKFHGTSEIIIPGDCIELRGVGQRHEGKVFVTGVNHEIADGAWNMQVQFGMSREWFVRTYPDVSDAPAGALLPAVSGLQIGIVTSLEADNDRDLSDKNRVQVRLPLVSPQGEGVWMRVACQDAGDGRGAFWRPEIGDEVVVGFLNDDPREAIILGMLNSPAKPAPFQGIRDTNHEKGWVTRSGMRMVFNDDKKSLEISTPGGKKIIVDEDADMIEIEDEHRNKVTMDQNGIVIDSAKDLTLKAAANLNIEAPNISNKAQTSFKAEAQGQAQLSASGDVVVKGAFVRIN